MTQQDNNNPEKNDDSSETHEQDFLEYAQVIGIQLGHFIALWDAPVAVKKTILDLLPLMTIEQQMQLFESFETAYLFERAKFIDEGIERDLESIGKKYEHKKEGMLNKMASMVKQSVDQFKMNILKITIKS